MKGHWCQEFGKEIHLLVISVLLPDLFKFNIFGCRIQEIPEEFINISYQTMECVLSGLKPLTMVTSYFDLTTKKQ